MTMRANRQMWRSLSLVLLIVSISVPNRAQSAADIKKKMDAHDYREALRMVGDALSHRDAKDEAVRYELLMLRGECQLQLSQRMEAIAAFDAAGKSASTITDTAK